MSTQTADIRTITVRAPASMTEDLERLARLRDRSLSGEMRLALREHLKRAQAEMELTRGDAK